LVFLLYPHFNLGWHPAKLSSYVAKLKNIIKKRENYIQEGGLDQNLHNSKEKSKNRKQRKW